MSRPPLWRAQLAGWLACLLCLTLLPQAAAEGSAQLLENGSYRASLETGNTNKGDLGSASPARKTSLFVYANAGEQLALGSSSLLNSFTSSTAINVYAGEINLTGASSTPTLSCKPSADKTGLIETRLQETSGPVTVNSNGYKPCLYTVPSSGIYTVEFLAPSPTADRAPAANTVGQALPAPAATDSSIAAWDVTVLKNGAAIPGRVWTTYLAMNSGGNGRPVVLKLYVQTKDGYRYQVTQNVDPFGFVFFANNKGVTNAAGQASFQSATVAAATYGSPVVGSDSGSTVTHKLFFNLPVSDLPSTVGSDWLLTPTPTLPPTPTGLTFTGRDGTTGYAGSANGFLLGGTFRFGNSGSQAFSYRLTIPLSSNGSSSNRVLTGTALPGTNTVDWDGLDGDGKAVPAGNGTYTASVTLFAGDVHFPLIDAENAVGLNITRQTLAGAGGTGVIYWDDRPLTRSNGVSSNIAGAPSPDTTPAGADSSSTPQHSWSSSFGDKKVMDAWAYYPSSPATAGNTVQIRTADISIVKTSAVTTAPRGGSVTYTLTVKNLTASTPGQPLTVTVTDPLPSWATSSSWSCPTGCATTSGTGALAVSVSLNNQTPVTITVTSAVSTSSPSGSSLTNTATVTRANDASDPDLTNNTSSVTLTARDAVTRLDLVKTVRNVTQGQTSGTTANSALPGDLLEYVVRYTNSGELPIANLSIQDAVPGNLTPEEAVLVCPSGSSVTITPAQSYNVALNSACGSGTQVAVGGGGTLTLTARVR